MKRTPVLDASLPSGRRTPQPRSRLLAACIAATLCAPAFAAELLPDESWTRVVDALNPYASLGLSYDSNIFRLDDDAPEIGGELTDQYVTAAIGFAAPDIRSGQQRFEVGAEVNHSKFNEHDDLDYTGSKANAIWYWSATNAATGTLGARHVRALRDFSNQSRLDRVRELRTENQALASAEVTLYSKWRASVRANVADVSLSESERLDLLRTTLGGALKYVSGSNNAVGIDGEFTQGEYDTNSSADFTEYTVGPTLQYRLTERTAIEATAGYTARDADDPERSDFDGATGRVVINFNEQGRSRLRTTVYRDLSNLGDEVSEFAVVNGVRFEPSWRLSENVDLRMFGAYEQRDFDRDPDVDLGPIPPEGNREDDVYGLGAFVDWNIYRNLTVTVGVDSQARESTRELQDFSYTRAEVRITGRL